MKFKGTKGDWKMRTDYDSAYEQPVMSIDVGDSVESLATIWSGQDKDDKELKEQVKADALLISKAPEMLEMLKVARDKFLYLKYEHDSSLKDIQWEIEQLIKEATEL